MRRIKFFKIFIGSSIVDSDLTGLQKMLDVWLEENPTFFIENCIVTTVASSLLITVLYNTSAIFQTIQNR